MKYTVHTDGGSRGNPGLAGIGVVIEENGQLVHEFGEAIGIATNNVAEYTAVIRAFDYLSSLPSLPDSVQFFLDSKLVVEQLNGRFAMKNAGLRPLFDKIQATRKALPYPTTFAYVPRAMNAAADALVNAALDAVR